MSNILHITWGGIALADTNEATRHWSTWTINLVDGSTGYGWTSEATIAFPHELIFELAGTGAIDGVVIDSRFEPVRREDGSLSQSPDGSPIRHFSLLGSTEGPDGPFATLVEGEAKKDARSTFNREAPARARWLKLVIRSNWAGAGATRLAEIEAMGKLDARGAAATPDVSGSYSHEYGPIVLRQDGDQILGCYNNGLGKLRGMIFGRIMRLAWFSTSEQSIGSATLVPANGQLYGFWYRDGDRMGSPWNAVKTQELKDVTVGACQAALYPVPQ